MIGMSCFLWFKIQNLGIPFLFLAFASLSKLTEQVGGAHGDRYEFSSSTASLQIPFKTKESEPKKHETFFLVSS